MKSKVIIGKWHCCCNQTYSIELVGFHAWVFITTNKARARNPRPPSTVLNALQIFCLAIMYDNCFALRSTFLWSFHLSQINMLCFLLILQAHFEKSSFKQNQTDDWKKLTWNAVPTVLSFGGFRLPSTRKPEDYKSVCAMQSCTFGSKYQRANLRIHTERIYEGEWECLCPYFLSAKIRYSEIRFRSQVWRHAARRRRLLRTFRSPPMLN